jgi:signal peptidase II
MASGTEVRRFGIVVAVIVALDLATKIMAARVLPPYLGVPLLGDALQLRLVYNSGAACGLNVGEHSRWIFMALSVAAIAILVAMLRSMRPGDRLRLYALAGICAGALGNLIDRVRSARGVVDFLDVGVGTLRWPTFNIADMAVTCGAIALAFSLWFEGRKHPVPDASPDTPPPTRV